jgi:hypothetical protein
VSRFLVSLLISGCLLYPVAVSVPGKPDTKLSPVEVINKHLESIGAVDARAKVRGTRIKGVATMTVREGGTGQAQGQVLLASQGDKNFTKITFESTDSPSWFKFDGSKASVSQFRPGRRTSLENFFASYEIIMKEGLIGGTLSEAWPLLKLESKNPKIEFAGTKHIDGRDLITLKYTPRKGSELKIILFFEPETFRHVRTEYSQTIYASDQQRISSSRGLPAPSQQRASNARINAIEEFSDFKEEQGLLLPHKYRFELAIQSDIRPALINWEFDLSEFNFSFPFEHGEASLLGN